MAIVDKLADRALETVEENQSVEKLSARALETVKSKEENQSIVIIEKSEDLEFETMKMKETDAKDEESKKKQEKTSSSQHRSIGIVEKSEDLEFETMKMKETGAKDEESKTESSSSQNPTATEYDEYYDDGDYSEFRVIVHPCLQRFNDMMLAALGPQLKRRKMMEPPSVPLSPPASPPEASPPPASPPEPPFFYSTPRPTKSYIY